MRLIQKFAFALGACGLLLGNAAFAQQTLPLGILGGLSGQASGGADQSGSGLYGQAQGLGGAGMGSGSGLLGGGGGFIDTTRLPTLGNGGNSTQGGNKQGNGNSTQTLPARPITAFQQFVYDTTGKLLPYFGDSALSKSVSLDADNQPVSADYEIGAGDEIYVRLWGSVNASVDATVDRDGQITIPSVGTFPVAGVKARNLDSYLSGQISKYYKNFNISATMGKLGGVNIYVAGQALAPGMHTVSSTSTLASVLFGVAQPGANGSYRNLQLKRDGKVVATFDLYDLLRNGELKGDRKLQSGDVVFVGQAGTRIALNVDGPSAAIYEVKPGETLNDVLNIAGTDRTLLRQDTVLIEGFNDANAQAPRQVEQISYQRALTETKLHNGDIVTVFPARMEFSNAVTLRGNVASPARYPYFPGMKVSDLIPSADSLITPSYYKKKSALVLFDKQKAQQTLVNQNGPSPQPGNGGASTASATAAAMVNQPAPVANPATQLAPPAGLDNPQAQTDQTSLQDVQETITNLLPTINWNYAVIQRLDKVDLKPLAIPFNLRKAIAKDPAADLQLQPGDVVTIFSAQDADVPQADKTPLIKVTGEVKAPGYYQVQPGETLRDVLVKAGGLTPDAYLFGTVFTRKAILDQQQKQMKKALQQAERMLVSAQNSNLASAVTANEAANAQKQLDSQKEYLDRLSKIKPDGRMVLEIKPNANKLADLPPLELVDGDAINVPPVPGQVSILGSVYSQGAFVYQKGRTIFDYLDLAGGAAKGSDEGSIFVIRANGTVDSARQGWVPFVSGLYGSKALPGDAIYVPEDYERVSVMRSLLDISQVFYQVGLGAAAIKAIQK
ncbi:MAG TPA: SLBB domain-containing protein [Limnobacter sp.]|uniref:SLBB domain-containing protein n=1 Tax=Limnobacter sp. TaxID=2003368 RepID=UPI002E30A405|nr:SLBB domain-containing protein [Limnobacter sp.]HEX5485530.1 SLBB domain-containing protein [Limnobacter sp.]